jgi:hypothetical protein
VVAVRTLDDEWRSIPHRRGWQHIYKITHQTSL